MTIADKHSGLLVLLVVLVSCAQNQKEAPLGEFGRHVTTLEPAEIVPLENQGILAPAYIRKWADVFIFKTGQGNHYLDLWDRGSDMVIHCFTKGRGFGELTSAGAPSLVGGDIHLYDHMNDALWRLSIPETLCQERQNAVREVVYERVSTPTDFFIPIFVTRFADGILATGLFPSRKWVCLLDEEMNEIDYILGLDFPSLRGMNALSCSNFFSSTVVSVRPDGKKAVLALNFAGAFAICSVSKNSINLDYSRIFYEPELKANLGDGAALAYSKTNRRAFQAASSDDQFIYLLYSGRTSTDPVWFEECYHLLVYDWDGKPVCRYVLEEPLLDLYVEDGILYGVSQHPDSRMLVYQINPD